MGAGVVNGLVEGGYFPDNDAIAVGMLDDVAVGCALLVGYTKSAMARCLQVPSLWCLRRTGEGRRRTPGRWGWGKPVPGAHAGLARRSIGSKELKGCLMCHSPRRGPGEGCGEAGVRGLREVTLAGGRSRERGELRKRPPVGCGGPVKERPGCVGSLADACLFGLHNAVRDTPPRLGQWSQAGSCGGGGAGPMETLNRSMGRSPMRSTLSLSLHSPEV